MADKNKKKRILLVDDDKTHLAIAENMLKAEYEINTAGSGQEALEKIYSGLLPNAILLDILMPDMDGWETYNRLKAITLLNDIPVAFFSSVDENSQIALAEKIGAADFITKPFNKADLLNRVKKMLEQRGRAVKKS
ncbi:MAG: response regulator [Treponema sp.]|nr:response regulator [Treponema sp.]